MQTYVDLYNADNDDDMTTNGELRVMKEMLPKCDTVFDVGANVGNWTALALNINPRLTTYFFEPSNGTFRRLKARRFHSNVVYNNFGLNSAAEERTLLVFGDGAGINLLYRRRGQEGFGLTTQQQEETVILDTVDENCRRQGIEAVDYLKVDIEGHELEVFKGASEMIGG